MTTPQSCLSPSIQNLRLSACWLLAFAGGSVCVQAQSAAVPLRPPSAAAAESVAPAGSGPALPSPGSASHVLHFVVEDEVQSFLGGKIAPHGSTALGRLHDLAIGGMAPGLWPEARLIHSLSELTVWLGDEDGDGDFFEEIGGEIDALSLRAPLPPGAAPNLEQWVFSVEAPWGQANPSVPHDGAGALDGTLFSLERDAEGALRVHRLLSETLLLRTLGQDASAGDDVDVDALAIDAAGNLYLSFRSTELIHGTLLADDGVVCLPAYELGTNAAGEIVIITDGCARIVLDKLSVDALVASAEVHFEGGGPLSNLGDLSGLAIDPEGGSFTPVESVPGLEAGVPHLFFTGSKLGPSVLSTRAGGSVARLNGKSLASSPVSGRGLGLVHDPAAAGSHDLAALELSGLYDPVPLVLPELEQLDPIFQDEAVLLFDHFSPHGQAWLLIDAWLPTFGEQPFSWAWLGGGNSQRFVQGSSGIAPLIVDARGRARLELPGEGVPGASLWLIAQAWDATTQRLSRPASIWCDHGGGLAHGVAPD